MITIINTTIIPMTTTNPPSINHVGIYVATDVNPLVKLLINPNVTESLAS